MGEIILVTGGARSGKSAFAEAQLTASPVVWYLATNSVAQDSEMQQRITLHQQRRPENWQTYEGFLNLPEVIGQHTIADFLLDCATMLTTNYFYWLMQQRFGSDYAEIDRALMQFSEAEKQKMEAELLDEWQKIVEAAQSITGKVVIVTNEVGLGIVPENPLSRWFRDIYGRVNQFLGGKAEQVYLVVAGIPMKIK